MSTDILADLATELEDAERARNAAPTSELEWPYLRREILRRGGIGPSRDWSRDAYPGDLYREHGDAPDLVAVSTMLGAADTPPWGPDASDRDMFAYLQRAYAAWQRAPQRERFKLQETPRARRAREAGAARRAMLAESRRTVATVAPAPRKPGERSFAELVAELKRKHGEDIDLSGLRPEYVAAYESGERVTVERDGRQYRGTIGATRGARPRFVLLLSMDL